MNEQESYEKLIDYVERELVEGRLNIGDRLPAERELSSMLQIVEGQFESGFPLLLLLVLSKVSKEVGIISMALSTIN